MYEPLVPLGLDQDYLVLLRGLRQQVPGTEASEEGGNY